MAAQQQGAQQQQQAQVRRAQRAQHGAALFAAAERGDVARIAALLDAGADVNAMVDELAALHAAAAHGHLAAARLLLERGADADVPGRWGCTPLHAAASHHDKRDAVAIACLLLDAGADVNAVDAGRPHAAPAGAA